MAMVSSPGHVGKRNTSRDNLFQALDGVFHTSGLVSGCYADACSDFIESHLENGSFGPLIDKKSCHTRFIPGLVLVIPFE